MRAYAIRLQFPIVRNKSSIRTLEMFRRAAAGCTQFAIETIKLLFLDAADGSYDFHVDRGWGGAVRPGQGSRFAELSGESSGVP